MTTPDPISPTVGLTDLYESVETKRVYEVVADVGVDRWQLRWLTDPSLTFQKETSALLDPTKYRRLLPAEAHALRHPRITAAESVQSEEPMERFRVMTPESREHVCYCGPDAAETFRASGYHVEPADPIHDETTSEGSGESGDHFDPVAELERLREEFSRIQAENAQLRRDLVQTGRDQLRADLTEARVNLRAARESLTAAQNELGEVRRILGADPSEETDDCAREVLKALGASESERDEVRKAIGAEPGESTMTAIARLLSRAAKARAA